MEDSNRSPEPVFSGSPKYSQSGTCRQAAEILSFLNEWQISKIACCEFENAATTTEIKKQQNISITAGHLPLPAFATGVVVFTLSFHLHKTKRS